MNRNHHRDRAARIVADAGGTVVGRTRLQKIGYLLEVVGLGEGFDFAYRHYGPFSRQLADGIDTARAFGLVSEEEKATQWGGMYSTYSASSALSPTDDVQRAAFAEAAASIDAIALELLATAAFLAREADCDDPWQETARLKPEKAGNGRLETARRFYRQLAGMAVPRPLPAIA